MPELTIVEFLTARLDEEEAAARAASTPEPWRANDGCIYADGEILHREGMDLGDRAAHIGEHVARWHPARVLADIAAKRALLVAIDGLDRGASPLLEALLQPYAERPDFQPGWPRTAR